MSGFPLSQASEILGQNQAELQAVILSIGKDALMYPLTSAKQLPKSLLPIGGVPLIWFQLSLLRQAGFDNVLIAVEEPFSEVVTKSVKKYKERTEKLGGLTITVKSVEEQLGTADTLRAISQHITNDFLVLSGDLIIDNVVEELANVHHLNDASVTMVLHDTKARKKGLDGVNYIALAAQDGRVLQMINEHSLEGETLSIPKAMLRRRPDIMVSTELVDMRMYIFSKWVIDYVVENEETISGIAEDLIPSLLTMQFRGDSMLTETVIARMRNSGPIQRMASVGSIGGLKDAPDTTITTPQDNITGGETKVSATREEAAVKKAARNSAASNVSSFTTSTSTSSTSTTTTTATFPSNSDDLDDVVKCHCLVMDSEIVYAARASTVDEYIAMNNKIILGPHAPRNTPYPNSTEYLVTKIGVNKRRKGTIVGEKCTLPKKFLFKQSILGSHCRIEEGAKVERCIIMDHVSIGAGASLKDTVIACNAQIGEGCVIDKTRAGPGYIFEDGAKVSREEVDKTLNW
jgi:translation initiation factor eIF-2B subunit gamma